MFITNFYFKHECVPKIRPSLIGSVFSAFDVDEALSYGRADGKAGCLLPETQRIEVGSMALTASETQIQIIFFSTLE